MTEDSNQLMCSGGSYKLDLCLSERQSSKGILELIRPLGWPYVASVPIALENLWLNSNRERGATPQGKVTEFLCPDPGVNALSI